MNDWLWTEVIDRDPDHRHLYIQPTPGVRLYISELNNDWYWDARDDDGWTLDNTNRFDTVGSEEEAKAAAKEWFHNSEHNLRRGYLEGVLASERGLRFGDLAPISIADPMQTLLRLIPARAGQVTLTGSIGVGKTALMFCTVNAAREYGIFAVYRDLTEFLDRLRDQYRQDENRAAEIWSTVQNAPILCIDEIDKAKRTEWVQERLTTLINHRYRRREETLTVLAANSIDGLPAHIHSRLTDTTAYHYHIESIDMRKEER